MKRAEEKIFIEVGPSRLLGLFLSATHLAALLVLLSLAFRHPLSLLLLLPLFLSWRSGWRRYAVQTADSAVTSLEWSGAGHWILTDGKGRRFAAEPLGRCFVAPWMTLLSFSGETVLFRRHLILLADNSDPDQLRRLRVRLRLSR